MRIPLAIRKMKYYAKGIATFLPPAVQRLLPRHQPQFVSDVAVRQERDPAVYARAYYGAWMRFAVSLNAAGFDVNGLKTAAEIGPGDSLALGLAIILSGAETYYGFDIRQSINRVNNIRVLSHLLRLFRKREAIPDDEELPKCYPKLPDYQFPHSVFSDDFLTRSLENGRVRDVRECLSGKQSGICIEYDSAWMSQNHSGLRNVDLIVSNAVMEHVDNIHTVYKASYDWLRKGGYFCHCIDFKAHGSAPEWNAHWTYSDGAWRIVRGACRYLINRAGCSAHVAAMKECGLKVLTIDAYARDNSLSYEQVDESIRKAVRPEDLRIATAVIIGTKE